MSTVQQFIRDTRKVAKNNGVTIKLVKDDKVFVPNDKDPCSGYFDVESKELVVSIDRSQTSYYGLLAHESSHMDQWIENRYLWDKHDPGYAIFCEWLSSEDHVRTDVLKEAVQDVIRVELDCERRAIAKIKKYNLPIPITQYIQGVNAYLFGYLFAFETRLWIPQIYEDERILRQCSTRLKTNYTKIPQRLHREMVRIYWEQQPVS